MDVSKEYTKMCDCPEIQEIFHKKLSTLEWEYDVVCVVWADDSIGGLCGTVLSREPIYGLSWEEDKYLIYNGKSGVAHHKKLLSNVDKDARVIWLPKQDQLQEMVLYKVEDHPSELFMLIEEWLSANYGDSFNWIWYNQIPYKSMEQLWLAFIMWELHQKKWDGNRWERGEYDRKIKGKE